jgi:glycosyltransferase involved in cell wall biosynthesis
MSDGCVLHVAALPFPSYQGTQAAIRAMLEASRRAGQHAELFTYATQGYPLEPSFRLHRTGAWPRARSLRSGPSLAKLLLDARMLCELHKLSERLRPSAIIAHHVEAAALTLSLRNAPSVFFAHTDLAAELPSYAAARYHGWLGWAGARLDQLLMRRAHAVATISRALCARFEPERVGRSAPIYVPTPWCVPEPIRDEERSASRRELGLAADSRVALYAGNLDAYQAVDSLLEALRCLGQLRITLLVATQCETSGFLQHAAQLGVACRTTGLGDETQRRRIHAAADFAIVPRGVPGGLPIKLLDALARGLPCAISPHAAAGLPLSDCVVAANQPGGAALADAVARIARDAGLRAELAERGRSYVRREHDDAAYLTAIGRALTSAGARIPD